MVENNVDNMQNMKEMVDVRLESVTRVFFGMIKETF